MNYVTMNKSVSFNGDLHNKIEIPHSSSFVGFIRNDTSLFFIGGRNRGDLPGQISSVPPFVINYVMSFRVPLQRNEESLSKLLMISVTN
jgi:hypothetical protein